MTEKATKQLPKYYEVDDVPVKVYWDSADGGTLCAVNDLGNAWAPIKAMKTGYEITEAKFNQLAAARAKKFAATED